MAADQRAWTTIAVRPDTAQRLNEVMPYETMSKDEFVSELIDVYEQEEDVSGKVEKRRRRSEIPPGERGDRRLLQ